MPRPKTIALLVVIAAGFMLAVGLALSLGWRKFRAPAPGSDRDEHGCLGSAGYAWCAREELCVRPWEFAAERKLPEGPAAFAEYCNRPKP